MSGSGWDIVDNPSDGDEIALSSWVCGVCIILARPLCQFVRLHRYLISAGQGCDLSSDEAGRAKSLFEVLINGAYYIVRCLKNTHNTASLKEQ